MSVFYSIFRKKKDGSSVQEEDELKTCYELPPSDTLDIPKDRDDEFDTEKTAGSIEEAYTDAELVGKYIVRDEDNRRFYVFSDCRQLYDMLSGSTLRCLHEIVLAGNRQKLRFDFDFNKAAFDEIVSSAVDGNLMSDLLGAPEMVLSNPMLSNTIKSDYRDMMAKHALQFGGYDQMLFKNQQIILGNLMIKDFIRFLSSFVNAYILRCDSYSSESSKFSVHLIVGAYTRNYVDMCEFAQFLYAKYRAQSGLAALCARFMDMAVYKSVQNFRLCLAVKKGAGVERQKQLRNSIYGAVSAGGDLSTRRFEDWKHTLLTHIGRYDVDITEYARSLIGVRKPLPEREITGMAEKSVNEIPDGFRKIIEPYSKGLEVSRYIGNMVTFRRIMPSFCSICRRTHDFDNSLLVIVMKNCYIVKCRRGDLSGKKIVIPIKSEITQVAIHQELAARPGIVGSEILPMTSEGPNQPKQKRSRRDCISGDSLMF